MIAKEYGFTHVTAISVSRLEYLALFYKYPYVVMCWLPVIIKNYFKVKSIKHVRYNISLLFVSLKKIHLAKNSSEKKVVIDEGLIQRFLSYSDIILTEREITRLIAASPLGTVLILLNDRLVTKDRYDVAHDRGSLGLERLHTWRHNMNQNILKIKTILEKSRGVEHFETKAISIDDILQQINKTAI
jgi:hypothetical protein